VDLCGVRGYVEYRFDGLAYPRDAYLVVNITEAERSVFPPIIRFGGHHARRDLPEGSSAIRGFAVRSRSRGIRILASRSRLFTREHLRPLVSASHHARTT